MKLFTFYPGEWAHVTEPHQGEFAILLKEEAVLAQIENDLNDARDEAYDEGYNGAEKTYLKQIDELDNENDELTKRIRELESENDSLAFERDELLERVAR